MTIDRRGADSPHRYRVTIEHLYTPHVGDALDPPLVFETCSQEALMLLFLVSRLRLADDVEDGTIVFDGGPARRQSTRPI